MNDLTKFSDSRRPLNRIEREKARLGDSIKTEVQAAALKADGIIAFTVHAMEGLNDLDDRRKDLAGDDPVKNMLFARLEARAGRKVEQIQSGLFSEWGL